MRELLYEDQAIAGIFGIEANETLSQLTNDADFIIANSEACRRQFSRQDKIKLLYNAVNVMRFDVPPISTQGPLKVGMISDNSTKKGVLDFVKIAQSAANEKRIEFYLIGPKNEIILKLETEQNSSSEKSNVHFIEYIDDTVSAISRLDVVLNLSKIGESFGRSIVEGMAARRPVIAYEHGAMSELIKHNQNGFLVSPGDQDKVLEYLRWLLENRETAVTMGEEGRAIAIKTFSSERFEKGLKETYQQIWTDWTNDKSAV
jgi:glycosyltransferase involved in cell wall biosynthesis